ncbi:MAG: hypothetical protein ACRETE_01600 [Stenotrophobium sp.]
MNPIRIAKNIALKTIPTSLQPSVRRSAIKAGLLPAPVLQYPFWDLMKASSTPRLNYYWGVLCGASVAKTLGYERISIIEFGVAGGNGLVALEQVAEEVERLSSVKIEVYGFDTGTGLTKPQDYRDLPQMWSEGFYKMDEARLRARLKRAELLLGPVEETVPKFLAGPAAPVAFVAFDLDMYSSTMHAFKLFEGARAHFCRA